MKDLQPTQYSMYYRANWNWPEIISCATLILSLLVLAGCLIWIVFLWDDLPKGVK